MEIRGLDYSWISASHCTGIDTVVGTVTGRVHDRGDEVDIGTVITKKVIVRGEKFGEGEVRRVLCNVAKWLQYINSKQPVHLKIKE